MVECVVLSENLVAAFGGKILDERYRAVLCDDDHFGREPVVKVEQPIGGKWGPTGGSWYLDTLLEETYANSDSLSIDHGQAWLIVSGMREALRNALRTQAGDYEYVMAHSYEA